MAEVEKKLIENNFDRMREVISNTKLPINVGDTTIGETVLRDGDIFRIATALINAGFRLELTSEWLDSDPAKWECSNCHYKVERWNNTLYCPVCGAKMN